MRCVDSCSPYFELMQPTQTSSFRPCSPFTLRLLCFSSTWTRMPHAAGGAAARGLRGLPRPQGVAARPLRIAGLRGTAPARDTRRCCSISWPCLSICLLLLCLLVCPRGCHWGSENGCSRLVHGHAQQPAGRVRARPHCKRKRKCGRNVSRSCGSSGSWCGFADRHGHGQHGCQRRRVASGSRHARRGCITLVNDHAARQRAHLH